MDQRKTETLVVCQQDRTGSIAQRVNRSNDYVGYCDDAQCLPVGVEYNKTKQSLKIERDERERRKFNRLLLM